MDRLTILKEKLQLVPNNPGCYQMINSSDEIIYVGKAKNLRKRLQSYFRGAHDAKTSRMIQDIYNFEYIVTTSEKESFLLELNFIKKYRPKYNILLMDDKTYPYIVITNDDHPRIILKRDPKKYMKKRGAHIFGPFPSVFACKEVFNILDKAIPFRKCNTIPKKSCLYYDMKQCLGPCVNDIDKASYKPYISQITRFLNGTDNSLVENIKHEMAVASEELNFEKAIELRNVLSSIDEVLEKQKISSSDGISRDIIGFHILDGELSIQILHMRLGKLTERSTVVFDTHGDYENDLLAYLYQFYENSLSKPKEVLISNIAELSLLEELLDINFIVPKKGQKLRMVELANQNAQINIENAKKQKIMLLQKTKEPLIELSQLLNIKYPEIIELFDNSNISGTNSVSGMVTYIDGIPSKKDYRKFKVKTVIGADDYHTMQEILKRRYEKVIKENLRKPDLIILDGGKTQVSAGKEIMRSLNLDIPLIGLLKDDHHKTDKIVTSDFQVFDIDKRSNLFLLLEAMQDEVHRFAVSYFRSLHLKNSTKSILDDIPGLGKVRKKLLINNFESIDEIKNAPVEDIQKLGIPLDVVKKLREKLNHH